MAVEHHETVNVLGVPVARMTVEAALGEVERLVAHEDPALVAFVNAHSLNLASRDDAYHRVLRKADLVLNDGIGLAIAGRLAGASFPENLNGTDLSPRILSLAASRAWRVFLLGGRPAVAAEAAARLGAATPGLHIVGQHHGFLDGVELADVIDQIRDLRVDVLLVGMGNPLQEHWLDRHLVATSARLGVGVGAFLDFAAGAVPRAPSWMRRARVEWVYRLVLEPGRMWRRYVVGNPIFVARVVAARLRARIS